MLKMLIPYKLLFVVFAAGLIGCGEKATNENDNNSPVENVQSPRLKPQPRKIDRDFFSVTLPIGWYEDKMDENYDPESNIYFEPVEDCIISMVIFEGDETPLEEWLTGVAKNYSKLLVDPVQTTNNQWGSTYECKGVDLVGVTKDGFPSTYRVRVFRNEKGDSQCLIAEGQGKGTSKHDKNFELFRETFRLK